MDSHRGTTLRNLAIVFLLAVLFFGAGALLTYQLVGTNPATIDTAPVGQAEASATSDSDIQPAASQNYVQLAARAAGEHPLLESPFVDVAEHLKPSTVNISAQREGVDPHANLFEFGPFRDFFRDRGQAPPQMPKRKMTSGGTGVIINAKGYVLTNNHVVDEAEKITVKLVDGSEREAKVIGTDPETDLALLNIGTVEESWVAKLGDSDDIRIGDWAVAMGNALGL
ncbi:MAG TPA: hypothetical protein ENI92_05455, partial [Bacteroidetes bacterium]|nr:hypothetical protein [Bacteroidota bacterium]